MNISHTDNKMNEQNFLPLIIIILQGKLTIEQFTQVNERLRKYLSDIRVILLDGGEYTTVQVFGLDKSNGQNFEEFKEKILENI